MAAPAICSPRCSPFYSPVSALSFPPLPASPFVFFSHPSRGRLSRGLARPITGCPPIHLFLPFSLFFFLSFFLFSPSLVSEPLSRFLRGSRSRPPRFPLSRQKGKREYSRILNFIRIHGTARISFQQFLKRIVSPFDIPFRSEFVNAFGFSADYSMDGSFSLEAKH